MESAVYKALGDFGWPVVPLMFGFIIDYLTSAELKKAVSGFLIRNTRDFRPDLSIVLKFFLDGFLLRIFGRSIFPTRFLRRSIIITSVSFVASVIVDILVHKSSVSFSISKTLVWQSVLIIFLITVIIDIISNAVSVSLIRLCARSNSLIDLVVTIVSDFSMTLTTFILLFPIGVIASLYFESQVAGTTSIVIRQISSSDSRVASDYQSFTFGLRSERGGQAIPAEYEVTVLLRKASKAGEPWAILNDGLQLIAGGQVLSMPEEAQMFVASRPFSVDTNWIVRFYTAAHRSVEFLRNGYGGLLELRASVVNGGNVIRDAASLETRTKKALVKCGKDQPELVDVDISDTILGVNVNLAACKDVRWIIYSEQYGLDLAGEIFGERMDAVNIPIFTSFWATIISSLSYYILIAFTSVGVMIISLANKVFDSPYLVSETRPFLFISMFLFFPMLTIDVVYYLLQHSYS